MQRLGIISCGKIKSSRPLPCRQFYISQLFKMTLQYAERTCDRVVVLSSKHGLLELTDIVEPYDMAIRKFSREQKVDWSAKVTKALQQAYPNWHYVHFAGNRYTAYLPSGEKPMDNLSMPRRLTWLSEHLNAR